MSDLRRLVGRTAASAILFAPLVAHAVMVCPLPTGSGSYCYFTQMPAYDQVNPNLAIPVVPAATFASEANPTMDSLSYKCGSFDDPFYESWLPYGPIYGDADSIWVKSCRYFVTDVCVPTADSMALMAELAYMSAATVVGGWTQKYFQAATPDPTQPGFLDMSLPSPSPLNPLLTSPPPLLVPSTSVPAVGDLDASPPTSRATMAWPDIQRVVNMAIAEGTDPTSGTSSPYLKTLVTDFTQSGVVVAKAHTVLAPDVSFTAVQSLIQEGVAPTLGLTTFTAHVTTSLAMPGISTVTFTSNGGGHAIAINGFMTAEALPPIGPLDELLAYNPVYAEETWIQLGTLAAGTYTKTDGPIPLLLARVVQLPDSDTARAFLVGEFPEQTFAGDPFDLNEGDQVIFTQAANGIVVP